jgi:uncharacterized membrane protein YuzA (DUF378 family)
MGGLLGLKWGSLASNSKSIGKSFGSIGTGIGQGLGGIFSPFLGVEDQLFGQVSDFTSSPIMYMGLGLLGVLLLTTIFKGASVATSGIDAVKENPELAAMAIKAAQSGL